MAEVIFLLINSLIVFYDYIDLDGELAIGRPRSIISPVTAYHSQDALQIDFAIYDLEQLDIHIENTMTSEVMYTYSLNPQQETTLYIPISDWESGSYTIYFVNPINDLYMYGEFYKE